MIPIRGLRAPVSAFRAPEPEQRGYRTVPVFWTAEMTDELRWRWSAGQSGSVIAEALGQGLSRGAVIARARRLGLERRKTIFAKQERRA